MSEEKQSAREFAKGCVEEMVQNLRANVAEDKARRERPTLEVGADGAMRMSDDEQDYPMNGPCCR